MAKSFKMSVFTRRWNHEDTYHIQFTSTGWNVTQGIVGGDGDKTGSPGLERCFQQDSVSYPANIGNYFEKIWHLLQSKEITEEKSQNYFNDLGLWISACEKATPGYIYD